MGSEHSLKINLKKGYSLIDMKLIFFLIVGVEDILPDHLLGVCLHVCAHACV